MTSLSRFCAACAFAFVVVSCGAPPEEIVLAEEGSQTGSDETGVPAAGRSAELGGAGRQGLRIVGSSTVFPFSTTVAENFGAKTEFPTPVVEATGTGGGMVLFCSGVGLDYPDLTGASRPMKATEYQLCQENGVTHITQIPIGFDGIVIGNSTESQSMNIAKQDLFLALAAEIPMLINDDGVPILDEDGDLRAGANFSDTAGYSCDTFVRNPFERWSDLDSDLPTSRIEVFGPPPTSGTRDAFVELGMLLGAQRIDCLQAIKDESEARFERIAARIREDGAWIDSGENDNAIVQTLSNSPDAFGVFGYSFLEQNGDRIQAATVDGVAPEYALIAEGVYPISRSMYIYVKAQHDGVVPGLREFVEELTSEDAWGPFGYLATRGLIALPEERRAAEAASARTLTAMDIPN